MRSGADFHKQFIRGCVYLLLFFIPLVFSLQCADPFRPFQLALFEITVSLLVFVWVLELLQSPSGIVVVRTRPGLPLFLFCALTMVGAARAVNPVLAWRGGFETASGAVFFFLITHHFMEKRSQENLLVVILLSAGLSGVIGVLQTLGMDPVPWQFEFQGRAFATFGNPNFFAGQLILILPLSLAIFLTSDIPWRVAFFFCLNLLLLACLLFTQTRGAWLGFLGGAVFQAVLGHQVFRESLRRNPFTKKALMVFLFISFAGAVVFFSRGGGVVDPLQRFRSLLQPGHEESVQQRKYLMLGALEMIRERPLQGFGTGNFKVAYPLFESRAVNPGDYSRVPYHYSEHAHNDYLQMAAERGLPALGAFLLVIAAGLGSGWSALRERRSRAALFPERVPIYLKENGVTLGLMGGVIALLIHAFFNFPFQVVSTAVTFWGFMGVLALGKAQFSLPPVAAQSSSVRIPGKIVPTTKVPPQNSLNPVYHLVVPVVLLVPVIFLVYEAIKPVGFQRQWRTGLGEEKLGHWTQAREALEKATIFLPEEGQAHFHLASAYRKLGMAQPAQEEYEKALQASPYAAEIYSEAGLFYGEQGRVDQAMTYAEKGVRLAPNYAQGYYNLGSVYFGQGKAAEARDAFATLLALQPDSAEGHNGLSVAYGALNQFQPSLAEAQEALRLNPSYVEAHVNLGVSLYKLHRKKEARKALEQALVLSPGNTNIQAMLKTMKQ